MLQVNVKLNERSAAVAAVFACAAIALAASNPVFAQQRQITKTRAIDSPMWQAQAPADPATENNVASGDPVCESQWHPLGVDDNVLALTVYNGDLIAGGDFIWAGGQAVGRIARWDGSDWHPFESGGQIGMDNWVMALTEYNGDLIAGGFFTEVADGQTVNKIARWDGSAWQPLESGGQSGVAGGVGSAGVFALTVYNGDLIAGGNFTTAGGQTVNNIARWDGSEWHPFTSGGQTGVAGMESADVMALMVHNGDLIAGGLFTTAGGQTVNGIARWDGSSWHLFTSNGQTGTGGAAPWVTALTTYDGDLIVGGTFTTAGSQTVNHIARWDGAAWHPFESGGYIGVDDGTTTHVRNMLVYNGDLIAGGDFTTAGGETVNHIARWDGSEWHDFALSSQVGLDDAVFALEVYNGDLIVGGLFTNHLVMAIPARGACCFNGVAVQLFEAECDAAGGAFQGEGVRSGTVTCPSVCLADLNGDDVVNGFDLVDLLSAWGPCPP